MRGAEHGNEHWMRDILVVFVQQTNSGVMDMQTVTAAILIRGAF